MPHLNLKIVSGSEAGQNQNYRFTQFGGAIGRAQDCDWTLIDSDRFISKKHLVISFTNQQFVLTDVSSNGVMINGSSTPLGKGNTHILQLNDTLVIGKHVVQVEQINLLPEPVAASPITTEASDDSDLLGLVMGSEQPAKNKQQPEILSQISSAPSGVGDTQPSNDLGLESLLSEPIPSSQPHAPFEPSKTSESGFTPAPADPFAPQEKPKDSLIPDDWEMFDSSPAEKQNISPSKTPDQSLFGEINNPDIFSDAPIVQEAPAQPQQSVAPQSAQFEPQSAPEAPLAQPTLNKDIQQPQPAQLAAAENTTSQSKGSKNNSQSYGTEQDDFFNTLYEKLGLSKEFKASVDHETFANDIATILLSTTQGLMSLLASRTAFKQESRMSSTLIQPRSNNPIKFSIDPADTLEMLLVKKKKGYQSVDVAYDEAMQDIQLHQMAFMAGLQGTLDGVLAELNPELIEQQVQKKHPRFMGLNSNSQCWQIFKEKQPELAKSVKENLNEVLGNYFSDAYQSHINSFKKDK